jgi:hypothetical protein
MNMCFVCVINKSLTYLLNLGVCFPRGYRYQYNFKKDLEYKSPKLSTLAVVDETDYTDDDECSWLLEYNDKSPQRPNPGKPSYPAKPKERTLPCYQFASTGKGGAAPGKCTYCHDPSVGKEFLAKTLEALLTHR